MKKLLFLLVLLLPVFAADPQSFNIWKGRDFKSVTKSATLEDFGKHSGRVTFRDKDGLVEVHQNTTDIIIIEAGEATMGLGGTQVNPKTMGPGEFRSESATGARKVPVAPGDIIRVPGGVAHQFFLAPGKTVTYLAIKVPAN